MSKNTRLVYSTDPDLNKKCAKCGELEVECTCRPEEDPSQVTFTVVLRLEKKGRGGKMVTVLDRLPRNLKYLKDLATELKKKCGTGGTFKMDAEGGQIEIQGDRRETIRDLLGKKGIPFKG